MKKSADCFELKFNFHNFKYKIFNMHRFIMLCLNFVFVTSNVFSQTKTQPESVLYYEFEVNVNDTFFVKSDNDWLPINNSNQQLFRCYVVNDLLIYSQNIIGKNPKTGEVENYISINKHSNSSDTLQFYYMPDKIYKQGDLFYKIEPSVRLANHAVFTSVIQLPEQVMFTPYAWYGGGYNEITDVYLHARLIKMEYRPMPLNQQRLDEVIRKFKTLKATDIQTKSYVIETAAHAFRNIK